VWDRGVRVYYAPDLPPVYVLSAVSVHSAVSRLQSLLTPRNRSANSKSELEERRKNRGNKNKETRRWKGGKRPTYLPLPTFLPPTYLPPTSYLLRAEAPRGLPHG
jgi:hypothetical protein